MIISTADSSSTPVALSMGLIEPLKNRSHRELLVVQEVQPDTDPHYIAALHRVLVADFRAGAITVDDLTTVLAVAADKMGSVRQAPGSAASWAMPGTPWIEHHDADPRVALIAWLIHEGADPWAVNNRVAAADRWGSFATTAGLLLTHGYIAATEQALDLPHASSQDLAQMCPNRWDYARYQSTFPQMAAHVGATKVLERLHELGADLGDALWHARDSDTVHTLIKLRARATGAGGPTNAELSPHWSKTLPATAVRPMMAALASTVTADAAVLTAARSNTWAPLKDAIDAYPEWRDIKTTLPSGLKARLPAAMIIKGCAGSIEARTAQALRLVARALPDDREIAPGLSEKSMVRLALAKTIKRMSHRTRTALKLAEQAQSLLDKLSEPTTSEQALLEDGRAFSAAIPVTPSLIQHASITNLILEYRLATPREFRLAGGISAEYQEVREAAQMLPDRTVDEMLAIARIMHAWIMDPSMPAIGGFIQAFGVETPSASQSLHQSEVANKGLWLDNMLKNNPERCDDVVYAGTVFTAYLMTHRGLLNGHSTRLRLDAWAARVEKWIDQGMDPGIDQAFAAITAERATGHPNDHARRFTQSLLARTSRVQMDNSVAVAAGSGKASPRF